MRNSAVTLGAVAASVMLGAASPALAASDEDLNAIRAEIKDMRHDYEHKIDSLEKRLRAAEADAKAAKAANKPTPTKRSRVRTAATCTASGCAACASRTRRVQPSDFCHFERLAFLVRP